jgi:hypothetical protein
MNTAIATRLKVAARLCTPFSSVQAASPSSGKSARFVTWRVSHHGMCAATEG